MMGHNIHFEGVIWKIIPKLSLLPLLIWSTGHLKNHENHVQDRDTVVQANKCLSQCKVRKHRDIFLIFFNMKVCCMFSIVSPHQCNSNEYTQYTIFNINKITLIILNLQLWDFFQSSKMS